jgi:hypothetical protein
MILNPSLCDLVIEGLLTRDGVEPNRPYSAPARKQSTADLLK